MSIMKKLWTAIRGGSTEVGQTLVDSQGIRIMEQELRDAETDLDKARRSLGEMEAHVVGLRREANTYREKIAEHESYGQQAVEKGDESLAGEIADKIVELEDELLQLDEAIKQGDTNLKLMKGQLQENQRTIAKLHREKSMVKTTENLQKTQAAMAGRFFGTNSSLANARESMERKKKQQQFTADKLQADKSLVKDLDGDGGLGSKLAEAGITKPSTSKADVMARFKKKEA